MRKFFCTIGVFLFLGFLIWGYCESYRIADMRDREWLLKNSGQIQAADDGTMVSDTFQEDTLPGEIVMADSSRESSGYGEFFLKVNEGFIVVYLSDKKTVYETTSIRYSTLPSKIQQEIEKGKYLKNQEELYSFMENYSS